MEKPARKELKKQLVNTLIAELKKQNEQAALKTTKRVKKAAKSIAKKFEKAVDAIQKVKANVKLLKSNAKVIAVKAPAKKAMRKPGAKTFKKKK